jgi:hypothetical protein
MGNSSNSKTRSKTTRSIMGNPASQQDSHVCFTSLELTGNDTSTISKLRKRQIQSVTTLKLSEFNITNETSKLCSEFVNLKQLHLYQCTFVNPEINLEEYPGLGEFILRFKYSSVSSLNLRNLRIKFSKGSNMWKFRDSALVEIL